jgi:hypothetical protein
MNFCHGTIFPQINSLKERRIMNMDNNNHEERNDFASKMIDTAIGTAISILIEVAIRYIFENLMQKKEKTNY